MNTFGLNFRISIFGESHGPNIGITIDGVKPGLLLSTQFLMKLKQELNKRLCIDSEYEKYVTPRKETELPKIISGLYKEHTTGAPLTFIFENTDCKSSDYDEFSYHWRPGHSDFVAQRKFNGFNDPRGSGHFSGRLTACLIAAGLVAKIMMQKECPSLDVISNIISIGGLGTAKEQLESLELAKTIGNSLGGIVETIVANMPVGLGEPFFDSLESMISHIIFAIPGVRGIEFGDGFKTIFINGYESNDKIVDAKGKTSGNAAGGINGGISNGNPLIFRTIFKPTSSIRIEQDTWNNNTKKIEPLKCNGRHDICFALRTPPIVVACTWIVLADLYFANLKYKEK